MYAKIAIVGATATGKSDLAVGLALHLAAEGRPAQIINADSMQLYRGMDIGTAKLAPAERGGVAHHLLDVLHVTETADVASYQHRAREVIAALHAEGVIPILVGGSGLYVRAALDGLRFPGTDPGVRERLERELSAVGPGPLHQRLQQHDPQAAEAILASNGRRIVRALEVIELTGGPFTATLPAPREDSGLQIGLAMPRERLDERVERRVERMWEQGLVEEVRELEAQGLRRGRTASRALGYAQVLRFLAGDCGEEEARSETVRATRRFVRRQESWFGRDPRIHWLDAADTALLGRACDLASADA